MSASTAAIAAANFAVNAADRAFARPSEPSPHSVGPPDAAAQFPSLAKLQRAFALATVSEGRVIEKSFEMALLQIPHFHVLGKRRVVVTEGDRALALRNAHNGLGGIEPPAATDPVDTAEIDCVAVDRRTAVLLLCDMKRSVSVGDTDAAAFVEACLGAHRNVQRSGIRFAQFKPLRIRWFAPRDGLPPNFVGREAVDEALKASVRDVVDHAIAAYRKRFAERLKAILSEGSHSQLSAPPDEAAPPTPRFAFDPEALSRAFNQGARFPRGA